MSLPDAVFLTPAILTCIPGTMMHSHSNPHMQYVAVQVVHQMSTPSKPVCAHVSEFNTSRHKSNFSSNCNFDIVNYS